MSPVDSFRMSIQSEQKCYVVLQAHLVRRGKPPVIQIHAEMMVSVKKASKDLFVGVQKDLGASTATTQFFLIACHTHVRRNFVLQGSMWGWHFPLFVFFQGEVNQNWHMKVNLKIWMKIK